GNSTVKGLAIGNFNGHAISLQQRGNNTVMNNYLGTDAGGQQDRGNGGEGTNIVNSNANTITSNMIVFNADGGSVINSNGNVIADNTIGTDPARIRAMGNRGAGFGFLNASNNRFVENCVAHNGVVGLLVFSGTGNTFDRNSSHGNEGLGIDLGLNGVTPNDAGDGDTGPNDFQNFPNLDAALSGAGTQISGTHASRANQSYTLQFFANSELDPTGFGEGEMFIGELEVATNPSGLATFTAKVPLTVSPGQWITATATDRSQGSTSEFSRGIQVTAEMLQYYPLPSPVRLFDTRVGGTGCNTPGTPLAGNTPQRVLTASHCGIPVTARAVTANVTVINSLSNIGIMRLYPGDFSTPVTTDLVYAANETLSNAPTVRLGSDGSFNLEATSTVNVMVDVSGYFAPPNQQGLYYYPLPTPCRLFDTRPGMPIMAGVERAIQANVNCQGITIPSTARAIFGNLTYKSFLNGGAVTVYPSGTARPNSTTLATTNAFAQSAFYIGLGSDGRFNLVADSPANVVIDVLGYFSQDAVGASGPGLLYSPLPQPVRLFSTNASAPACEVSGAPLSMNPPYKLNLVRTCMGSAIPATARAVSGNLTVSNLSASLAAITLYPSGAQRPMISICDVPPGQNVSNCFIAGLGQNGGMNISASQPAELFLDVSGCFVP
ncbi:MAG: right-handed parallel beta-helix repeat-containing protein, partial [Acidobacteria bacterium]|nr:right-handed parallel beta-helix repeat-containing protein [Acidobacteriota bacterium]